MVGHAVAVVGVEHPLAGEDIVEEVVVADKGAEGVEGRALLPPVLVEAQVQKVVVGEDRKGHILHHDPPAPARRLRIRSMVFISAGMSMGLVRWASMPLSRDLLMSL